MVELAPPLCSYRVLGLLASDPPRRQAPHLSHPLPKPLTQLLVHLLPLDIQPTTTADLPRLSLFHGARPSVSSGACSPIIPR
ncbi:hypothetical protein RRG08_022853 [Elysia crispata]|uniref:Uncharacterized protein n=1 Tax=Elysia crispata TaxID=231223 RepID=A0AAE0Z0Z3_9GAST|nr:hypothetical protein RRG08_022853 [Elysia crispata]